RPGFTFTGWNTAPDGSGTAYQPGDTILITGDVVLYAQWTQNQEQCFICVPCCCVCANPCVQRRCE
ncbi:MAG: InlB B-repeat-containing protein, partial [Oscillospiraceae bacterium]|nr:InlB B-repeat-containing protein [Oscillospiraceae bacterium]